MFLFEKVLELGILLPSLVPTCLPLLTLVPELLRFLDPVVTLAPSISIVLYTYWCLVLFHLCGTGKVTVQVDVDILVQLSVASLLVFK